MMYIVENHLHMFLCKKPPRVYLYYVHNYMSKNKYIHKTVREKILLVIAQKVMKSSPVRPLYSLVNIWVIVVLIKVHSPLFLDQP